MSPKVTLHWHSIPHSIQVNMFILLGYNTKAGRPVELSVVACPACGEQALFLYPFYRYVHLFWFPFFPFSKEVGMHCGACHRAWQEMEIKPPVAAVVRAARRWMFPPLYTFAGAIICALPLLGLLIALL